MDIKKFDYHLTYAMNVNDKYVNKTVINILTNCHQRFRLYIRNIKIIMNDVLMYCIFNIYF